MRTGALIALSFCVILISCSSVQTAPTSTSSSSQAAAASAPAAKPDEGSPWDRLLAKAGAGDVAAQFSVAQAYEKGDGAVPRDYEKAFEWYGRAATAGDRAAQFFYGAMYASHRGTHGDTQEDIVNAVSWYRRSADQGYLDAFYPVAYAYEFGLGGYPRDNAQAVTWYTNCAVLGNPFAMRRLSLAYRNGELGLAVDVKKADEWAAQLDKSGMAKRIGPVPIAKPAAQ